MSHEPLEETLLETPPYLAGPGRTVEFSSGSEDEPTELEIQQAKDFLLAEEEGTAGEITPEDMDAFELGKTPTEPLIFSMGPRDPFYSLRDRNGHLVFPAEGERQPTASSLRELRDRHGKAVFEDVLPSSEEIELGAEPDWVGQVLDDTPSEEIPDLWEAPPDVSKHFPTGEEFGHLFGGGEGSVGAKIPTSGEYHPASPLAPEPSTKLPNPEYAKRVGTIRDFAERRKQEEMRAEDQRCAKPKPDEPLEVFELEWQGKTFYTLAPGTLGSYRRNGWHEGPLRTALPGLMGLSPEVAEGFVVKLRFLR